jgi:hypothetical protein
LNKVHLKTHSTKSAEDSQDMCIAGLPDGIHIFKPIWVNFWRVLQLVYVMAIWSILRPFGIFCGHLVHFIVIWYILPGANPTIFEFTATTLAL